MTSPSVYYNEIDPFAAAWLKSLMLYGYIPEGFVDTRPIQEVQPDDLLGYSQCHFFAGIGGWAHALGLAGWDADRPVWTGSCPCQPFSAAGKQQGFKDERHLWPAWFRLIATCHPPVLFGEQVESAIRGGWWDLVQRDLEGENYACGMAVLGAHSVGAPHQRQRCWFVADYHERTPAGTKVRKHRRGKARAVALLLGPGRPQGWPLAGDGPPASGGVPSLVGHPALGRSGTHDGESRACAGSTQPAGGPSVHSGTGLLGHPHQAGPQGLRLGRHGASQPPAGAAGLGGGLADSSGRGTGAVQQPGQLRGPEPQGLEGGLAVPERGGRAGAGLHLPERGPQQAVPVSAGGSTASFMGLPSLAGSGGYSGAVSRPQGSGESSRLLAGDLADLPQPPGFWSAYDWLPCRDHVSRPVEPGTFPLAHGVPSRVGLLRGYGNAIVPQAAAAFIEAYLEAVGGNSL